MGSFASRWLGAGSCLTLVIACGAKTAEPPLNLAASRKTDTTKDAGTDALEETTDAGATDAGASDATAQGTLSLTVNKLGGGAALGVVSAPPLDCGTTCTQLFAPGTVHLHARTANGQGIHFEGWGGACAAAGSTRDCTIYLKSSQVVTATFAINDANLVFVTSDAAHYPSTLGATAPYDAKCNAAASRAGINSSTNDAFIAWIGAPGGVVDTPMVRLGAARGFKRLDGRPFSDRVEDLIGPTPKIWNPLALDENGAHAPNALNILSSVLDDGTIYVGNCYGWTSNSDSFGTGSVLGGPESWTYFGPTPCNSTEIFRLFCFQKTITTPGIVDVPATATGTVKRIFLSREKFFPGAGIDAAHAHCNSITEKPDGAGTYKALLATTTTAAAALLTPTTSYATPDLQLIGSGAQIASGGALETGIWQFGDRTFHHIGGGFAAFAWTGSHNMNEPGTKGTTCEDWLTSTSNAIVGDFQTTVGWWDTRFADCSSAQHLYCIEQ